MGKFIPIPLYSFLQIVTSNGGFSRKGIRHSIPWFLKTIIAEPFRWVELATKNRIIKEHTIRQQPIFILGYYRSGTTYLQQMFMQDQRLGNMSLYQAVFPELMLTFENIFTPLLEFLSKLVKARNPFHRIPLTWHSPGEEDVGLGGLVSPHGLQWCYLFPEKISGYLERYVLFENISNAQVDDWKNTYCYLLKKLSIANNGKQLVLKNPPNTARIKMILSIFPAAKFIYIHRNPFQVYASNKQLWKMIRETYMLGRTRSVNFNDIILDTYEKIMTRYLQDKELIPAGHLLEIAYETFVINPVETMRNIYHGLNFGDFSYCEPAMVAYANKQKNYSRLQHNLQDHEYDIVSKKLKNFIDYSMNGTNEKQI